MLFYQLHTTNTFLEGDILEEVYIEQPPEYVSQGESLVVCKLKKAITRLKKPRRVWVDKFSNVVAKHGLVRTLGDLYVFIIKQRLAYYFGSIY